MWGTRAMYCSTVSAVSPLAAICTMAGSFSIASTWESTPASMVAENSSVWRVAGVASTMRRTEGRKPMSSMRSASSSTRICTWERSTAFWFMRSMRRPGVAMSTSTPRASRSIWGSIFTPPTTLATRRPRVLAMTPQTSWICMASSRVGVMTSMAGAFLRSARASRSSDGSEKVLPVPVLAAAIMSRPSSTSGMDCSCTGVGSV